MKNLLVICDIPDANIFFTSVNSDTLPLLYSKDALLQVMAENTFERIGIAFEKKELFDVDFRLFNVKHIDFLACDTLNDPMWLEYYKTLQDAGITVGASDNQTGNLKYGGDWVMESTSQDIEKVYFSGGIEYYKYLLGMGSAVFVMKSNGLYGSGNNTFGQLGNGKTGATAVSCGGNHTAILVGDKVYSCGYNYYGQLGYDTGELYNPKLTDIGITEATAVSCGGNHTAILIGDKVYSCGWNVYGQLGYTTYTTYDYFNWQLNDMGKTRVTAVSCGGNHTAILVGDKVYSCGYNYYGQLGYTGNGFNTSANITLKDMGITGATAVSCGSNHTAILIGDKVYSCGWNFYGQLGYTGNTGANPTLKDMGITGATAVSCGSNHTAILIGDKVYSCGYNQFGQLGYTGNTGANPKLTDMKVTEAIAFSCGSTYTVVLKRDGTLYLCGKIETTQYNTLTKFDTDVLNINDSGKLTTYLNFIPLSIINISTTLSATSNSPGTINYTSSESSILSINNNSATPHKKGKVIITITQQESGNYLSQSFNFYTYVFTGFSFIGNHNIQPNYVTVPLSNYSINLPNDYNIITLNSNYICMLYEKYIIIYNSNNIIYKTIPYSRLNITKSDIKDVLFINNILYIATNNNIYNFDVSLYYQVSPIMSLL